MESECPICFKHFPSSHLQTHVNICLDKHDAVSGKSEDNTEYYGTDYETKRSPLATEGEERKTQGKNQDYEKARKTFTALGMRFDTDLATRRLPSEVKSVSVKTRPTLTGLLIAEKKIKGYGIKDEHKSNFTNPDRGVNPTDSPSDTRTASPASEILRILNNNAEKESLAQDSQLPLAHRLRPSNLDEYFGQRKLVGKGGVIRNMIETDTVSSFVLWGPPGVGKTTLARIIANSSGSKFIELSGSDASLKKLKESFEIAKREYTSRGRRTILFLDEIHRFNKSTQDVLLPVMEKGLVTVIGATTENPSFSLNNALLSRLHTFVMESLSVADIVKVINRGLLLLNKTRKNLYGLHLISLEKDAIDHIASICGGDSRSAINILEAINVYLSGLKYSKINDSEKEKEIAPIKKVGVIKVNKENLKSLLATKNFNYLYDRQGESHYDTISAFHKAIRGSDADAAIFYLTRMLLGGEDPLFIARRMIVIASEDIGLRDSSYLPFAVAVKDAIEFVGMPEGEIVLAHCAVRLARAPKSTKSYRALRKAQNLLQRDSEIAKAPIPLHLRNAPTKLMKELGYGNQYKYNPDYAFGAVKQSYMPEGLADLKFIEKIHLGSQADPEIDTNVAKALEEEEQDYREFKKRKKEVDREIACHGSKNSDVWGQIHGMLNKENGLTQILENPPEQFLQLLDQGFNQHEENSDDSECENNFDCSYDEFLELEDQPRYFKD